MDKGEQAAWVVIWLYIFFVGGVVVWRIMDGSPLVVS